MATIAPIVGKFRRSIIRDIALCLTTGTGLAFAWWQFEHVAKFNRIDNYYKNLAASKEGSQ